MNHKGKISDIGLEMSGTYKTTDQRWIVKNFISISFKPLCLHFQLPRRKNARRKTNRTSSRTSKSSGGSSEPLIRGDHG